MNIIGSLTEEMNIITEGFVEQFCLHKYRIPQTAKVINRLVKKYNWIKKKVITKWGKMVAQL